MNATATKKINKKLKKRVAAAYIASVTLIAISVTWLLLAINLSTSNISLLPANGKATAEARNVKIIETVIVKRRPKEIVNSTNSPSVQNSSTAVAGANNASATTTSASQAPQPAAPSQAEQTPQPASQSPAPPPTTRAS